MEKELKVNEPFDTSKRRVISDEAWMQEHREHVKLEKEFTKLYDKLVSRRKNLGWRKIEKEYIFDGPDGLVSLADLFQGRNQLIVQHFMFAPDDKEGCVGCSFTADHVDSARMHFENNDVSFVAIARAPIDKLLAYKKRMDWGFNWVSSFHNDFNFDFHVSFTENEIQKGEGFYGFDMAKINGPEAPGTSVFYKDENGDIFQTYSSFARGGELMINTFNYLDITPKGRNEIGENGNLTDWVRHHDKYNHGGFVDHTGKYHEENATHDCCSNVSDIIAMANEKGAV